MSIQTDIQRNKNMYLENTLVMYGVYNAETLERLVKQFMHYTVDKHCTKRIFTGTTSTTCAFYSQMHGEWGIQHYAINSMLYMRTIKDKYMEIYHEFISQLHIYTKAVRILAKGYLPISLITPLKLQEILHSVKGMLTKTNPDYDIVIKRLHLYYDLKLVTFGIDRNRNLIIQFPVFVQLYTQKLLKLYQLETAPVPIVDKNTKAESYMQLKIKKPCLALNTETYINVR